MYVHTCVVKWYVFTFFFVKDIDTKEESVKLDGAGGNSFQTCCKTPKLEGIFRWILHINRFKWIKSFCYGVVE